MKYIDLGLNSGTFWADTNEDSLYTFDDAVSKFGDNLPTKEQFEELKNSCTWTWQDNGYKVVGPNGNSIFLPAEGFCSYNGKVFGVGSGGYYWFSTHSNSSDVEYLFFDLHKVNTYGDSPRCFDHSIRLIKNNNKDNNMEKELKIVIPSGYEIDKEKSTFERIIFKRKESIKPKSWEEYVNNRIEEESVGYYIDPDAQTHQVSWKDCKYSDLWRNVLPNEEYIKIFITMMQLMSLREDWIHKWSRDNGMSDDWEPNWDDVYSYKYYICGTNNKDFKIDAHGFHRRTLSFPTKEMATEFLSAFKDLIKIAAPLI